MKLLLTQAQLDALTVGEYFPEDQSACVVHDRHLEFTDRDAAWRVMTEAANLADEWASYWKAKDDPLLAKFARRDCRSLSTLASRIIRS